MIKKYIKKIIKIIKKPEMKILPGHLAFFLVLSIIPIITMCGFVASMFNISLSSVIEFMENTIPSDINKVLIPFISGSGMDLHIGFSVLVGYVVASNGAQSIIVCSNTLYGISHSNYLKRRIKALFLTILLVTLFVFTLFVLAFGNSILKLILSLQIFSFINKNVYIIYLIIKWPIAILFIFMMVKLIYTMAPDSLIKSKYTNKGALFTTLAWIISTFVYSYYVMNFSHYDIFYGSLSNIIVMMMWIYILAYAFVIGIAINVNTYMNNKKNIENNN